MKKTIVLILFFFIYQFGAAYLVIGFSIVYGLVSGHMDNDPVGMLNLPREGTVYALLLANGLMLLHLWLKKYIPTDKPSWSSGGWRVVMWLPVLTFCVVWIETGIQEIFFVPDILADHWQYLGTGWGLFGIVILGPVVEELLFRGTIIKILLQRFSPWIAILISSLIFGIIHLNPAQTLYASALGLLLGWLYYRTRSVLPGIILHILNNGTAMLSMKLMPEQFDASTFEAMGVSTTAGVLLVVFCVGLLVLAIWQLRRATPEMPAHTSAFVSTSPADHCSASETDAPSDQSAL